MNILGIAWENILIGLLSGVVVFTFTYLLKMVKEKLLEKKYPIAGSYITEFEDEENELLVRNTAPAVLKQRGNRIFGETDMSNDGRKWILEGQISEAGHIHGIYYAPDPHDRGIGNFFLYVRHNRVMEGLWSGYDSVNNKINSGKYIFRPVFQKYNFSYISDEFIPSVIAISDEELGKDYLTINTLKNIGNEQKEGGTYCQVVITPEHGVVGFCTYSILTVNELLEKLKVASEEIPNALLHSERVGTIDVIAVKNKYKRQGIGYQLVGEAVKELNNRKISVICSIGWRSKKGINIGGIFKNYRFQSLKEYKDYWKDDSLNNNYFCHDCGNPPCTCSAILYARFK